MLFSVVLWCEQIFQVMCILGSQCGESVLPLWATVGCRVCLFYVMLGAGDKAQLARVHRLTLAPMLIVNFVMPVLGRLRHINIFQKLQ